jgi:hypothetical protein
VQTQHVAQDPEERRLGLAFVDVDVDVIDGRLHD